ncbi:MAG: selenide, water dikinase SelD [Nitrospirae bacterium]|nr:MAG: selenide, water dikinase SelD [Nitrospirota bacterium]
MKSSPESGVIVPPGDDAGVRLVDEEQALVETVDVITPLVDTPYLFGRIAAANSLSDIYAMGGRPFTALSILGYPSCDYPVEVIKEIIEGANHTLKEAGVSLLGGHCFEDTEIKFGLSVSGFINRDFILRVNTPREGNILVLTKPVGTGVLTTALKGERVGEDDLKEVITSMCMLNSRASEAALKAGATACTDLTGFGLLGHASNMLSSGGLDLEIDSKRVPLFEGVMDFAERGMIPEGAYKNRQFYSERVQFEDTVDETMRLVLFDPQTSGGLLIALNEENLDLFKAELLQCWVIGRFKAGKGKIRVF